MIHSVTSTLETFKPVRFTLGLNIVVAEKSQGATSRQTRNGSGKSSLVRIIDFLLGAKCDADSIFRAESLLNESFSLQFDLADSKTNASRSGSTPATITVDADFTDWLVQPKVEKDSGDYRISNANWITVLGQAMFGIPLEVETYGPSFRSMLSYFVRRESSGAFQEAQKQSSQQQHWDVQVNLSYLFGVDWTIAHALQQVRKQESSLEVLKREAKSGVLGELVGNLGELRTRLAVAERETGKLQKELANFQVLAEYHELEREASRLAIRISELANENTLDLERIDSLSSQYNEEQTPPDSKILELYNEIGIVLPELVGKRLEEVRNFHSSIIRNRRTHLLEEINDATRAIERRSQEMATADARRLEIMVTLNSHGALDQFSKLQEELSRQQANVEELKKKLSLAKQLDAESTELTIERAQIKKRLTTDIEDKAVMLNEAIVIFEEFSKRISDHEGSLVIEPTDNGPEFSVIVEGKESKGIRNMQIFCFDMTLAVLWSRKKAGPGFLVHDSHLFDGMDSRQVAKAIEIGAEQAAKHGFQYIVCINSDQLIAAEFSKGFDASKFRNPVQITDATEDGGIFGMRIQK